MSSNQALQQELVEHDDNGGIPAKRVKNYSFNADSGLWEKQTQLVLDANGNLPTTKAEYAQKITVSGSITYIAKALPGTAQATAAWQAKKIDESVAGTTVITWANGDALFDNVATDLTALVYS